MNEPPTDETVQSFARGLAVIRAFDRPGARMTLSDVARATDLTRATARRLLRTLEAESYVGFDGRHYFLRPRILELGHAYFSGMSFIDTAQPFLLDASARLHESVSMSVLDGDEVIYVARQQVYRIMSIAISIGTRFPAYATSMGRVLLAALPETEAEARLSARPLEKLTAQTVTDAAELRRILEQVRRDGWCMVEGELEDGLRSLAVPVREASGRVLAAVNVAVPASRVTVDVMLNDYLPVLRRCASEIAAAAPRGSAGTPRL